MDLLVSSEETLTFNKWLDKLDKAKELQKKFEYELFCMPLKIYSDYFRWRVERIFKKDIKVPYETWKLNPVNNMAFYGHYDEPNDCLYLEGFQFRSKCEHGKIKLHWIKVSMAALQIGSTADMEVICFCPVL